MEVKKRIQTLWMFFRDWRALNSGKAKLINALEAEFDVAWAAFEDKQFDTAEFCMDAVVAIFSDAKVECEIPNQKGT